MLSSSSPTTATNDVIHASEHHYHNDNIDCDERKSYVDSNGKGIEQLIDFKQFNDLTLIEDELSDDNNNNNSDLPPKAPPVSLIIPQRPAPMIPTDNDRKSVDLSPSRPAPSPPVAKTRRSAERSKPTRDYLNSNFVRQDSINSSLNSNSSSCSSKSDASAAVSELSVEEQRKAESRKLKEREQRGCVIMELLQTERDYKLSLEVCTNIFLRNASECAAHGIDSNLLFGNIKEVIEVSARLIQLIEESTLMKKYENQRVGKCFLQIADDMRRVYSYYCRNHDEIQPLWQKYEAQPDAKQYLQRGLERMKEESNCFDIPSVLIKPVQRILKYKLILSEMLKCTEDDHEDKPDLIAAIDLIGDIATYINEFKRRQELVEKYRKDKNHTLSDRFSTLNLHSVMKKSSRLGLRITSTIGLLSTTKDQEFTREYSKFRTIDKTIKLFVKNLQLFTNATQEFLNQGLIMVESVADYYAEKNRQPEVDQLRTTHRVIMSQYLSEFQLTIEREIMSVLNSLLAKFSGPYNLIHKRNDKLLDFDSFNKKLENNKDIARQKNLQEQQLFAKNNYEALNSQLLDELPKLYDISLAIFKDSLQSFFRARKQLIGRIARHYLTLSELPLIVGFYAGSSADIIDTFHIKHNILVDQLLCDISLLPSQVFPSGSNTAINPSLSGSDLNRKNMSRSSRRSLPSSSCNANVTVAHNTFIGANTNKKCVQSASQRAYLQSRYKVSQLYQSQAAYEPCDVLDIYLNNGDLVGVIKQQDPMGSRHRWFVDTGTVQGFVPSKLLTPYQDNSWITPPSEQLTAAAASVSYSSSHTTNTTFTPQFSQPFTPQHQYKLYSPSAQPQGYNCEVHRYDEVPDDLPPQYDNITNVTDNYSENFLPFDESSEGTHTSNENVEFNDFDPYSPYSSKSSTNSYIQESTNNAYSMHHQYKVHPSPVSPLPPQSNCETSRYENLDVPPIYRNVSIDDNRSENLLSFEEKEEKVAQYDLYEYDPLASSPANHRYEEISENLDEIPETSQTMDCKPDREEEQNLYIASYPFVALGENELSLEFGQPVVVRHKCDLTGNNDWWFVEDKDGKFGYVPSNYLTLNQRK